MRHVRQAWHALTSANLAVEVVPLLARGKHKRPRQGASLLELVAVYAHEPWSSYPPSVNRALATAAQAVNDHTSDGARRHLIPLVPFLAETGGSDPNVSYAVATVCLDAALPLIDAKVGQRLRAVKEDVAQWEASVNSRTRFGAYAPAHSHRMDVAISQAVAAVAAAEPQPAPRAASLRTLLVAATTAARQARGLAAATPSISLAEPDHIRVITQWVAEPGCDWRSLICLPAGEAEHTRVFGVSPVLDTPV